MLGVKQGCSNYGSWASGNPWSIFKWSAFNYKNKMEYGPHWNPIKLALATYQRDKHDVEPPNDSVAVPARGERSDLSKLTFKRHAHTFGKKTCPVMLSYATRDLLINCSKSFQMSADLSTLCSDLPDDICATS